MSLFSCSEPTLHPFFIGPTKQQGIFSFWLFLAVCVVLESSIFPLKLSVSEFCTWIPKGKNCTFWLPRQAAVESQKGANFSVKWRGAWSQISVWIYCWPLFLGILRLCKDRFQSSHLSSIAYVAHRGTQHENRPDGPASFWPTMSSC